MSAALIPATSSMTSTDKPSPSTGRHVATGMAFTGSLCMTVVAFGYVAVVLLDGWNSVISGEWSLWSIMPLVLSSLFLGIAAIRWGFHLLCLVLPHGRAPSNSRPNCSMVTIIVPAFNEEDFVVDTLSSLVRLDHPNFEIIVVDDGSTDQTAARCTEFVERHADHRIRLHSKANGGKWSALNVGYAMAAGDFIMTVDADSVLKSDALQRMMSWMADAGTTAVAGQVKIANRDSIITRLQSLEYLLGNAIYRRAQSLFGSVLLIPGPIALFRRTALEELPARSVPDAGSDADGVSAVISGPFEGDTFAEDFDLSVALLSEGGRVVYESSAIAYTRAPAGLLDLLHQRYRWIRGNMQVCRKFFGLRAQSQAAGNLRTAVWMAATFVFELTILPLAVLAGVIGIATMGTLGGDLQVFNWLLWMPAITFCSAAIAVNSQDDDPWILWTVPLYDLFYGPLLTTAWVTAAVDEVSQTRMKW